MDPLEEFDTWYNQTREEVLESLKPFDVETQMVVVKRYLKQQFRSTKWSP